MKISILGNNLTSLTLAKTLTNQGIAVDIFSDKKKKKFDNNQTLGISKTNVDFFNKNITNINKFLWKIKRINIYSENFNNNKILDFKNAHDHLFSVVRNQDLYNHLFVNLNRCKLIRFKKTISLKRLLRNNYDLIFNCDHSNLIAKKFFHNKIEKNYNTFAHVTTFKHKKLSNNNIAYQVFTKDGPLAFLPISSFETSVVYSAKEKKNENLVYLINKYKKEYKILNINKITSFELKSSNLRSYYFQNIIAFGDLLHRLHPLAGQGFNMSIRDIKEIDKLIEFKKAHGLGLDKSIGYDFEKKIKNKNYLFSSGIDFIYEFFKLESNLNISALSKLVKFLGKKEKINKFFTKSADSGIVI